MADDLMGDGRGRVVEAGPVDRVYDEPDHLRAAELVGFPRASRIDGRIRRRAAGGSPRRLFEFDLDDPAGRGRRRGGWWCGRRM